MIRKEFNKLVRYAKKSKAAMNLVIKDMDPLIKGYTKKLFFMEYEDAVQELKIALIEAVQNIEDCSTSGACIRYLQNAVRFRYLNLIKHYRIQKEHEDTYVDPETLPLEYTERYNDMELKIALEESMSHLKGNQKRIFLLLLVGYSDREIAELLNLSRQYINRVKKKFLI